MSYNFLLQKANELYLAGAYHEAEQLYRQILAISPNQPDILNMLGLIAQNNGNHYAAVEYFYQALENAPNHWPIYFNLAVSSAALNNDSQAVRYYEKALFLKPDLKEAYLNIAAIYEKNQAIESAVEYYRRAIETDSDYLQAKVCLAALTKQFNQLHELAVQYPTSPLPLYYLAQHAYEEKLYSEALSLIKKALEIDDESPEINLLYAETQLKLENTPEAVRAFYRVLQFQQNNRQALLHLAILEKNEAFFKRILDLEPNLVDAHIAYADFLAENNRILEALEEYRRAVILNPDSAELSNNLALIVKDLGEYERSIDLFFNAFMITPDNIEISQNIAQTLIHLHKNNPQKALQIAQQWLNTAPKNIWAIQTLAFFRGQTTALELLFNEKLFDAFASNYEQTMHRLDYQAVSVFQKSGRHLQGKILDLGCGTGFAAEALKTTENSFIGIDISQNMLNIAKAKGIYHTLIKSDILSFLQQTNLNFDGAIAFDVFNYLKNPEQLFAFIYPKPLVFTIENAPADIQNSRLMPNGRYQHNPQFIADKLKQSGYTDVSTQFLVIRKEDGVPVEGTLFMAHQ